MCKDFDLNIDNRTQIRHSITDFILSGDYPFSTCDIDTVVGEVIQNVLRHAYGFGGGILRVSLNPKELIFEDFGEGFSSDTIDLNWDETSLEKFPLGGMGLKLMARAFEPYTILITTTPHKGTRILFNYDPAEPAITR